MVVVANNTEISRSETDNVRRAGFPKSGVGMGAVKPTSANSLLLSY